MKTRYIIAIAASLASCIACQKNDFETVYAGGDSIVRFAPSVSGGNADALTKGELYNETTGDVSLGKYVDDFMVAAWSSAPARIIPDAYALDGKNKFKEAGCISGDETNGYYQKVMKRTKDVAGNKLTTPYWMTMQPMGKLNEGVTATGPADDEYIWKSGEVKTFYAYANLPESGATVTNTASGQTLQYTVPATASEQTDILLGFYSGDGETGSGESAKPTGTAGIVFQHPLTAVKFVVGDIKDNKKITGISIKGLASSGQVTMDAAGALDVWTAISNYDLTASVSNSATLAKGDVIGTPFVVIPQNLTAHSVDVTVTLEDGTSGTLSLNSDNWQAGYTNTYTINFGTRITYSLTITPWDNNDGGDIELDDKDYQYEFNVADNYIVFSNTTDVMTKTFSIESYRHEKGDDIIPNREPVAYNAEYSIDGGTTWLPFDAATIGLTGLLATDNAGAVKETKVSLSAPQRTIVVEELTQLYRWKDDTYSAYGMDLSRMQIGGEGDGTALRNTANCYIVKHPGTYILPCVYGNAIQNGVETDYCYKATATDTYALSTFLNSEGNAITNAWVLKDLATAGINPKATLMWTDAKNNGELLVHDVQLVNASGTAFSFGTDAGDAAYIKFTTATKDNMTHGNAVVVLYDDKDSDGSYDEGEALWNWHLWITDADLSDQNVGVVGGVSFMSRNLGWCDGASAKRYSVAESLKRIDIRLTQDNSASSQNLIIMQPDAFEYTACGNNTYYQWGRKDPFPGSESGTLTAKAFYGAGGESLTIIKGTSSLFPGKEGETSTEAKATTVITNYIKYPRTYATNYVGDGRYRNLWALNNTANGEEGNEIKTVYDPCPYGYVMPNSTHIHAVKSASPKKWQTNPNGFLFNNNNNLFFPVNGFRKYDSGELTGLDDGRFCTSSTVTVRGPYRLYIHRPINNEDDGMSGTQNQGHKSNGYSVRPILEQ